MDEYIWPGSDDRHVVTEMKEDRNSPHWKQCYLWVSRLVGLGNIPENLKEDIVQEAMISISKGLPDFHFESRLTTWLTTVVSSRKKDAFRRKKRQGRRGEISLEDPTDSVDPFEVPMLLTTEEECILREELRDALYELQKAFDRCSNRDKVIIKKHFQDEQKYSEIAAELGMSSQMVAYVCNRIRRPLRKVCQRLPFK